MKRSAVRELLKLTQRPDMISFAGGLPAPELFPVDAIQTVTAELLRDRGAALLQYGETEGVGELRDWIAESLSTEGWVLDRSNVMITSGAQQALDLIGRVFVDEGDSVVVDNPTYLAALSAWRPCGARFRPRRNGESDSSGTGLDRWLGEGVKLIYQISNFSNPTGLSLGDEERRRWVEAMVPLGESRTIWIEDDPYGALRYEGTATASLFERAAARFGAASPVLSVGTISKVLVPGLRVGWVAGDRGLLDALVRSKQAADLHSSPLNQWIVLELLRRGQLDSQLPQLRRIYGERRDAMLEALEKAFGGDVQWTRPEGGMFVWVTLPETMDAAALLERALARGVAFVPGAEFHVDGGGRNTLRLNFTHVTPDRIREGIQRLKAAWWEIGTGHACRERRGECWQTLEPEYTD